MNLVIQHFTCFSFESSPYWSLEKIITAWFIEVVNLNPVPKEPLEKKNTFHIFILNMLVRKIYVQTESMDLQYDFEALASICQVNDTGYSIQT
jgi:hypothetical protein